MSESENRRIGRITWMILLLCLVGMSTGAYLLYRDIYLSAGAGVGEPIAAVKYEYSAVRRKTSQALFWRHAANGEMLYHRDSIQTGSRSTASVKLNDGSSLELSENSLVVLDSLENTQLNLLAGSGVRRTSSGDQLLTVVEDGTVNTRPLPVRLLTPSNQMHFFIRPDSLQNITFDWQEPSASGSTYRIEISQTSLFKKVKAADQKTLSLGAGDYFWRVRRDDGQLSETRTFKISPAIALHPTWPVAQERVSVWTGGEVQFRWRTGETDCNCTDEIEIAQDDTFSQVVRSAPVDRRISFSSVKGVPPGHVYWRIKSTYPSLTVYSKTESFLLSENRRITLNLTEPADGSVQSLDKPLRLAWNSDATNAEYTLEVQSENESVTEVTTRGMSYVWKSVRPGSFRWRVRALAGDKSTSESAWQSFRVYSGLPVTLLSPKPDQEIRFWKSPGQLEFSWKEDSLASAQRLSYKVEIARDAAFKTVMATMVTKRLSAASSDVALASGVHFWRVHVVSADGHILKSSEPSKFDYGYKPLLQAPALLSPESGFTVNLMKGTSLPVLRWQPVEDAKTYSVSLVSANGKVIRKTTNDITLNPPPLSAGIYQWSVRAVDPLDRLGEESSQRIFKIEYGDLLPPPESLSPEVQ